MNKWSIYHKMKSDMQVFAVEMCCVGVAVSVAKTPTVVDMKGSSFHCALTI